MRTEKLYQNGIEIGEAEIDYVDNCRVLKSRKEKLMKMKADAKADGVDLTLASSFRTFDEQLLLRKQNVIDKTKVGDIVYLKTASHTLFKPFTGKPGFGVHNKGMADDWNVMGKPDSYKWLVKNAIKYGMVRTVASERWHFEDLPHVGQFAYVPKTDSSWDGILSSL
jgi:LAS superfamily LD-carboxypeptidase LdcB